LSPANALAELRRTTRDEHDRIEHLLRLTEPMPLARYATILSGFGAFLRAWEPRVLAALPERLRPWYEPRRRARLASADVDWLVRAAGQTPRAMNVDAALVLPLVDAAQAFGSLYVIEGSALGGRVIEPLLKKTLGLERGHGASYFHGFGEETGAMWSDFRAVAAREIGDSPEAVAAACQSARRSFAALLELFASLSPLPTTMDIDLTEPPPPDGDITHVRPAAAPLLQLDVDLAFVAPRDPDTGPDTVILLR